MLDLYYFPASRCSKKVKMALIEKNIPHKTHLVNLFSYDQMKPEFLRLNPKGLVPVLVHEEKVVVESDHIVDYLDKSFESSTTLVPKDQETLKNMWEWIELQENYPSMSWKILSMNNKYPFPTNIIHSWLKKNYSGKIDFVKEQLERHPMGSEFHDYYASKLNNLINLEETLFDESKKQYIISKIEEALDRIEAQVGHTQWLLGDIFSLADIVWLSVIDRLEDSRMGYLWENGRRPAIEDYLERLRARPSYKLAFKRALKAIPLYILLSYFS
jgi:glutathione S-transferase